MDVKDLASGSGFGKVILFGEHFVVYGLPAIASAVSDSTIAEVSPVKPGAAPEKPGPVTFVLEGQGWTLHDSRPETPGYKVEKAPEQKKSIDLMVAFLKIDTARTPLKITLAGNLKAASGVGASAASCAAIARGLSGLFGLDLTDAQVNEVAHEGEKGYHGTPSGIDDTAATYGGLFLFRKGQPRNLVELINTKKPVEIVMGNTGLTASTTKVVDGVKARRAADPEKFERIFADAERIVRDSKKALEAGDYRKVGELMNRNHELLVDIGVSGEKLEQLVGIARKEGAPGAKITGTGVGGYMVALTPGRELQERVARAMEKAGFAVLRTSIGK
jgi:mevalonate kinase